MNISIKYYFEKNIKKNNHKVTFYFYVICFNLSFFIEKCEQTVPILSQWFA